LWISVTAVEEALTTEAATELRTVAAVTEKALSSGGSGGWRCREQQKLQMCPSVVEEAIVLSLDGERSCTQKQWGRRELHIKAGLTDLFIESKGSIGPVHQRQRQWLRMK
ncbi:hypothetical protein BHE74_00046253, partial [Ensete ventricosum]